MNDDVKAATDAMRELKDDEIRARVIRRGFGGDRERFERFVSALREALPSDVTVILRGSAVIGVRWEDGAPFDADGPGTSDLDLTLVGGDMLELWSDDAFYIPKLHTAPLNDDTPHACPSLVPLRRALCRIAGRPVNIQATSSFVQYARDVLFDQPYFTLIEGAKDEESDADEERPIEPATDDRLPRPSQALGGGSSAERRRDPMDDARA
jgi:hypothetical protein